MYIPSSISEEICGHSAPPYDMIMNTNRIYVVICTDGTVVDKGFRLSWAFQPTTIDDSGDVQVITDTLVNYRSYCVV